ncbi:hypothetical protein NMQ07_02670 [Cellulosimicrobium cellulans]|nr:hypothetical protein NMQ07_02670 [Cellulosimicrobium cellulans]
MPAAGAAAAAGSRPARRAAARAAASSGTTAGAARRGCERRGARVTALLRRCRRLAAVRATLLARAGRRPVALRLAGLTRVLALLAGVLAGLTRVLTRLARGSGVLALLAGVRAGLAVLTRVLALLALTGVLALLAGLAGVGLLAGVLALLAGLARVLPRGAVDALLAGLAGLAGVPALREAGALAVLRAGLGAEHEPQHEADDAEQHEAADQEPDPRRRAGLVGAPGVGRGRAVVGPLVRALVGAGARGAAGQGRAARRHLVDLADHRRPRHGVAVDLTVGLRHLAGERDGDLDVETLHHLPRHLVGRRVTRVRVELLARHVHRAAHDVVVALAGDGDRVGGAGVELRDRLVGVGDLGAGVAVLRVRLLRRALRHLGLHLGAHLVPELLGVRPHRLGDLVGERHDDAAVERVVLVEGDGHVHPHAPREEQCEGGEEGTEAESSAQG